ncbi:PIN domain-containing protein [Patescibacteria group bacterium]|nr:PIN domain-containing protein [Patescibacteria group bacterium]
MTKPPRAFIDSDVIISSLISKTGVAHFLIHKANTNLVISNYSQIELKRVVKRLNLKNIEFKNTLKKFKVVLLQKSLSKIKKKFTKYVTDQNDAHIIAGAVKAKTKFLISYNQKHFKANSIKRDFNIILFTPAQFLQYLRSISSPNL